MEKCRSNIEIWIDEPYSDMNEKNVCIIVYTSQDQSSELGCGVRPLPKHLISGVIPGGQSCDL